MKYLTTYRENLSNISYIKNWVKMWSFFALIISCLYVLFPNNIVAKSLFMIPNALLLNVFHYDLFGLPPHGISLFLYIIVTLIFYIVLGAFIGALVKFITYFIYF